MRDDTSAGVVIAEGYGGGGGGGGGGGEIGAENSGRGTHSFPNLSLRSHRLSARRTSGNTRRLTSKSTSPRFALQKHSSAFNIASLVQHASRLKLTAFGSHRRNKSSKLSSAHDGTNVSDCARTIVSDHIQRVM